MKQKQYFTWMMSCLISCICLFPACKGDNTSSNPDEYISLFPKIRHNPIRINDTFFEPGDEIGVFVVPYLEGNTQPGDISQSTYAVNVPHIYTNGSWQPPVGEPVRWPSGGRFVDIFSYYPYAEGFGESNPLAVPFTVESDQSTAENYNNSDLLWAEALSVAPQRTPVELIFGHRLSKARVNIRSEIDILDADFESAVITILNVNTSCLVDLSIGNITAASPSVAGNVTTFPHPTPIAGYRKTVEGIIVPQVISQGVPFIRIEFADGRRFTYTPDVDLVFDSGYERSFNIVITAQGLAVTVLGINNWSIASEINAEINEQLPKVVDLRTIDWNQSKVHSIYDNGIFIAEVCWEYLFSTVAASRVDYPAIVVYTVNTEGDVNRTTGYIAQALNRNRNTITQEYEPNTSNVHGGNVTWGANNSLGTFTAGTLPLTNKIEITGSGINLVPESYITSLTTSPQYATDIDGNNYSIVKVSSQYWMAENLKAENYRNGDAAEYYYYNNDPNNKDIYGALYLWTTVADSRGICPQGWHPTENNEFISIYQYLTPNAGGKMKANVLWSNLNNGDNVSGFSGLPGGRRTNTGVYNEILQYGQWWTSTQTSTTNAYRLYLAAGDWAMHNETYAKTYAQSLRCLRD